MATIRSPEAIGKTVTKMAVIGGLGVTMTVRGVLVTGTAGAIEVSGNLVGEIAVVDGGEVGGVEGVDTTSSIIKRKREMSSEISRKSQCLKCLANPIFFYHNSQVPKIGTSVPDASEKPAPTSTSQPPAEATATETSAVAPSELTLPDAPSENATTDAAPETSRKRAREIDDDGGEDAPGNAKKTDMKSDKIES